MAKATHSGTCQICGSNQKLPNGKLSKHGYTVQWGFFSGVCGGAGHLPFEQSIDLIDGTIRSVTSRAEKTEAAAKAEANSTSDQIRYSISRRDVGLSSWDRSVQFGHSSTTLVDAVVTKTAEKKFDDGRVYGHECTVAFSFNGKEFCISPVFYHNDYDDIRNNAHKAEAHRLTVSAKNMRDYVQWQKERIKGWKPSELKPV